MSASLRMHSTVLKQVRQASPREDLRRQRVFAWAVTGLILTGCVSLTEWSVMVVTRVQAASTFRRLWRFLGNAHIDVASYYRPFIGAALAGWAGCEVRLAIDTTSLNDRCVVCRIALVYRGRSIPLVWQTFDTRSHSLKFKDYEPLLEQACRLLPKGCSVTLLGDRGFGGVALMRWCIKHKWHFALRLKGNRIVIHPNGRREHLRDRAFAPGEVYSHFDVRLPVAPKATFGPVHVHIALSPEPGADVWYIVTDRADGYGVLADYRCRMHIESAFKDDKSGAFQWEDSRITNPAMVDRLLLVMAVAALYLTSEGTFVVESGERTTVDPHTKRGLSYLQIGRRAIQRAVAQARRIALKLHLSPHPDPEPLSEYGIPFPICNVFTFVPASAPAGS
jgi:hypothetical protein